MFKSKKINLIVYILAFLTSIIYLGWRIIYTIPWEDSPLSYIFGVILWLCELVSYSSAFVLIANKSKTFNLEKGELTAENMPDIDVFIATHNEDYTIVYKTLNACVQMDYPDKSKVHIYIADDTNRPEIKALAEEFNVGYCGLENNKHAKSGNLNNALSQTNSPYIATFDADMIPYKEFLLETVPYFLADRENQKPIGLIQTPQSFYNPDIFQFHFYSEDKLPNEQDFFSKSVNVLNNTRGAAVYTGSNTLLSRQAIEDAGGFPVDTITEDFELGVRMNIAGYLNYSTTKPLASGLTPTDLRSVVKQRVRWGRGVIKSSYNTNIFFNPKLSLGQRVVYVNGYLYWSSFFRRLVYILAPILYTVFHMRIVKANVLLLLIYWLPSYVFSKLAMRDVTDTYRTQTWGEIVETVFAPYLVLPLFFESIGISEKKFKVTSKDISDRNFDYMFALPYFILWVLSVYGLITFNIGKYGSELFYGSVISFWLIHHLINLTFALFATLGRPIYRTEERFLVDDEAVVDISGLKEDVTLVDVSEHGLSFISRRPLYIKEHVSISLNNGLYSFTVNGRLARIVGQDNIWRYAIRIDDSLDEKNKKSYYHYIFDRTNDYLTKERDSWVTIWDDLSNNLLQRFYLLKQRSSTQKNINSTMPKIQTKYPILIQNQSFDLISFDGNQVELWGENIQSLPETFIYETEKIRLHFNKLHHQLFSQTTIYSIERMEEVCMGGIQQFYDELYKEKIDVSH